MLENGQRCKSYAGFQQQEITCYCPIRFETFKIKVHSVMNLNEFRKKICAHLNVSDVQLSINDDIISFKDRDETTIFLFIDLVNYFESSQPLVKVTIQENASSSFWNTEYCNSNKKKPQKKFRDQNISPKPFDLSKQNSLLKTSFFMAPLSNHHIGSIKVKGGTLH